LRGDLDQRTGSHGGAEGRFDRVRMGSSDAHPEKQSAPDGTLDSQKHQDDPARNGARGSDGHGPEKPRLDGA